MFKFIESICQDPIRFFLAPNVKLKPGHVVQLKEIDGNIVCYLSDGTKPFGVVGEVISSNKALLKWSSAESKLNFDTMVKVYQQKMIFQTDQYDADKKYVAGSSLYVNSNGIFTSEAPSQDSYFVAKIITPPSSDRSHFEALWL
jgi:hypothetical protein